MGDWAIDAPTPAASAGSEWTVEPESSTDFLKPEAKNRPRPARESATANDETTGDEDLATPGSKRTFEATGTDLAGQFKRLGAELDAQRSTPSAAVNVFGNAATFGAGPAISAAGSKLVSLLPGQAPVNYDQARQANQAQLEKDRAQVGGLGTAALETAGGVIPALVAPELEATQALSPVARGIAAGAGFGATQGLGESASKGDLAHAGRNMTEGAVAGGLTGGLLEGGLNRAAEHAATGEDSWLVHDILGGDIKTQANPTERKVLADDEADLKHTLASDPSLRRQINKSRGGDPGELQKLLDQTQGRLQAVISPREEHYANFDEESPQKGFRVGDLEEAVAARKKDFNKTGGGKERNALQSVIDELHQFEGNDHIISPTATITTGLGDIPVTKVLRLKHQELGAEVDPLKRQAIQGDIDTLMAQHGQQVYNPDKIIPTKDARDILTNLQGAVHDAMGGFNEKAAYKRARLVVAPIQDAFESHLNTGDPELVGQIRDMNRRYSALKNIEAVVKQRLNKASQQNLAVQKTPTSLRAAARGVTGGSAALAFATGHPVMGAAMAAGAAAPEIARGADMALARLISASKSPTYKGDLAGLVRDAIQRGVPRSVALQFAGSTNGGEVHDVAESFAP